MQSSILDITHDLQTALSGAADQLTTTPSLTATELATPPSHGYESSRILHNYVRTTATELNKYM